MPFTAFIPFVHSLADAAGAAIRPYFGAHGEVDAKADHSPVTEADRAAERAIRDLITAAHPTHAIYGEEFGQQITQHDLHAANPSYTWVIDPIDGTRAFIAGHKEWGTLIALCEDGVPVLGVLDQPITGERWLGVRGQPTLYNGNPIHTRPCASLAHAEFSTTSAAYFTPEQAKHVVCLAQACRHGVKDGDCYAYGLLARGLRDLVLDAGVKPYDILALVPIIEGAGGTMTAWDSAPITLTHFATALAAGDATLYAHALEKLS